MPENFITMPSEPFYLGPLPYTGWPGTSGGREVSGSFQGRINSTEKSKIPRGWLRRDSPGFPLIPFGPFQGR